MKYFRILFLLPLLLLLPGCSLFHNGERIAGQIRGENIIPDTASRIYIKPVKSSISDSDFNNELLQRVKNTINLDGRLAVTDIEKEADIILFMEVTAFSEQGISFDTAGRAVTVRISLTVTVSLVEQSTGRNILSGKTTDLLMIYDRDRSVRSEVLRSLADKCSERVLSIILTGWDSGRK